MDVKQPRSHFRLSDLSSCLSLDDGSDSDDSIGSPCKTNTRNLNRSRFQLPDLEFSMPKLRRPPPLSLTRQSSIFSPVHTPTDSPSESVTSLTFTPTNSELSEIESDVSTELEPDDYDLNVEASTPSNVRLQILHRQNRSVVGLSQEKFSSIPPSPPPIPSFPSRSLFNQAYIEEEQGEEDDSEIYTGRARLSSTLGSLWVPSAKVRRTQSMFATPEQMLHEQLGEIYRPPNCEASVSQCMSYLESPECIIPTFTVRQDPFFRMTHETLCGLFDGTFGDIYEEILVIDCRFEYEYEGGHISGAINANTKQQLEQALFRERECDFAKSRLLVFHCEYSAFRSPMMASHLRKCDRELNASRYPLLFYPDVVVLEGGYSQFYASAADRCVPQNYVGMNTKEHENTCEREMTRFRQGWKTRKTQMLGMSPSATNSTPQLADFKFPAPALALRSASTTDFQKKPRSLF